MNKLLVITAQLFFISTAMSMEYEWYYFSDFTQENDSQLIANLQDQETQLSPISICPDDILGDILCDAAQEQPVTEIPKNTLVCKKWSEQTENNVGIKNMVKRICQANINLRNGIVNIQNNLPFITVFAWGTPKFNQHIQRVHYDQHYIMSFFENNKLFCPQFKFKERGYADLMIHYHLYYMLEKFIACGGSLPILSYDECERLCATTHGKADTDKRACFKLLVSKNYDFSKTPMLNCAIRAMKSDWVCSLIGVHCDVNKASYGVTPLQETLTLAINPNPTDNNKNDEIIFQMAKNLIDAGANPNLNLFDLGGLTVNTKYLIHLCQSSSLKIKLTQLMSNKLQ